MQKRQEERQHSGIEEPFNAALSSSPTAGGELPDCLCLQVLQETSCAERAGSQLGDASSMPSDKAISDDIVIGPMPHTHTPPSGDEQTRAAQVQAAFLCGVINGIITIPVMTSFAAIIFQASRMHHPTVHACRVTWTCPLFHHRNCCQHHCWHGLHTLYLSHSVKT